MLFDNPEDLEKKRVPVRRLQIQRLVDAKSVSSLQRPGSNADGVDLAGRVELQLGKLVEEGEFVTVGDAQQLRPAVAIGDFVVELIRKLLGAIGLKQIQLIFKG